MRHSRATFKDTNDALRPCDSTLDMAVGSAHARKNKKPVVAQQQSPVVMTPEETLPWTTNEPGRRGAGLRWSLGRGARGAVASLYRVMCLPSEEGQVLWQEDYSPTAWRETGADHNSP